MTRSGFARLFMAGRKHRKALTYMMASESVALDALGYELIRDVAPGEAVFISLEGQLHTRQCAENPQ